ncbi:MAG: hypothetical protein KJ957_04620 [Candidatus Omnitrophica bacterium]|nr:hypothetical protein [Candidatus Omnitrophota bacterium]
MSTCLLRSLSIILFLISLSSCDKPTYSKEKVTQSIIKLCKDEYNLDNVQVKIIGSTLGVYIPLEGLVDSELKLNRESGEKIEDVALSMHRVIMSTDRPLKFYTLTARDTKTVGVEFILTGFVYDVVRVRLLDISRGEYHKRILRDFKFNPMVAGEAKIKELFKALNEDSLLIQDIKPLFYPIYTIGKKGSQKLTVVDISSKEMSDQEALFYIKTKEYYEPQPGYEVYRAIFPAGFDNEYLILINIAMFQNPIKEIVPKYFYSGAEIRQRDLKETFDSYKDMGYIGIDGFPEKDLEVGWFISEQIARRIKILFQEDNALKENFTVNTSEGSINNGILQFEFSITSNKPSEKDKEIIFSEILKHAGKVIHRYSFKDFEGIEVVDSRPKGEKVYLSKDDLERFRRGRVKIQDLMTQ